MASLYNGLPGIAEASKMLEEHDTSVLLVLSNLLIKYQLQSRFGVVLVHKHFDLVDDSEKVVDLKEHRRHTYRV